MILIDGDILIYQSIASAEQEIELEDDIWVMQTDLSIARENFRSHMSNIVKDQAFTVCVSDPKANWRKEVYPEYKSHRKKVRKPMAFKQFREWACTEYKAIWKPNLEADDVIGILATKPGNDDCLIWSEDKDLRQIPGTHLMPGGRVLINTLDGDGWHLQQTLTGDPVDGYPGCPGIGPVKAAKILSGFSAQADGWVKAAWPHVIQAYEKAGLTEADALIQARVARICRWEDWDQEKQKVKLWTPTI